MPDNHDEEPPASLARLGLPHPAEARRAVIILIGVVVSMLALAAVLGYVVFHALSDDTTTVGIPAPWVASASTSRPG